MTKPLPVYHYLIYVESCNCLYSANYTTVDDCVTRFPLDLNPANITAAVGPTGGAPSNNTDAIGGKALGSLKECCPTPATQTIDQTYCEVVINDVLFLNEIFPCDGIICGAEWVADAGNIGMTYDECGQSITITDTEACGTFTKQGSNNQCGAFNLTYNVEILTSVSVSVSADQTVCVNEVPTELSATTTSSNIQWQMSTTSCTNGFTNIDGATAATYTPTAVTETRYYRVVVTETATCSTGNCSFESDCIIVNIDTGCVPTCITPTATAYALAASCTNGVPNDDAYLQISAATDATHYNFIAGSDYTTGNTDIANATPFDINTDLPLQFGTLANPSISQDYTIRIFNTESDCFTDITVTLMEQDCSVTCACEEFIYVNEVNNGGRVHKFSIDPTDPSNGTVIEIYGGANLDKAWYPGDGTSEMPSPHGLGADLNGFLYIAESFNNSPKIRRFNCDGEITPTTIQDPVDGFHISGANHQGISNIQSYDGVIYANGAGNTIFRYNPCDGAAEGTIVLGGVAENDWGFWIDQRTGIFYATNIEGYLWKFTPTDTDFNTNASITPFIFPDATNFALGNNVSSGLGFWGITTDLDENMYVVDGNAFGSGTPIRIVKYDASGSLVAIGPTDSNNSDGTGWNQMIGLVYSETSNRIYSTSINTQEDCLTSWDLDLTTPVIEIGPSPTSDQAKGINILKECCPTPNRQTINQVYCVLGSNEAIFLNDLFPCDGVICEGQWVASDAATDAIYNDCDQSIAENIAAGCYSFTKGSNGTGNNPRCGAFELNFNLEILDIGAITMSADQTVCSGDAPAEMSVTTTATDIQWQMSTTSCTDGFTNIDGATAATYTPTAVTETTYYRAIVIETAACASGNCAFESDCITVNVETTPTLNVDGVTCDAGDTTYTVDFTSDGTVTSTAGTVAGNQVIDIPVGTDATITATLNGCTNQQTIVSPNCGAECPSTKCMQVTLTKTN